MNGHKSLFKNIIVFSLIVLSVIVIIVFSKPAYAIELHQKDDLFPYHYPPSETYIQKLSERKELVTVFFYNYGGKKTYFEFDVKSLSPYKQIEINNITFIFDNSEQIIPLKETYSFKGYGYEYIPNSYHEIYHSKKKLRLRNMFRNCLETDDHYPVYIDIDYSIDGGEIRKSRYYFEANRFIMKHIIMIG